MDQATEQSQKDAAADTHVAAVAANPTVPADAVTSTAPAQPATQQPWMLGGMRVRSVVLAAALVEGGTWRERVVFREATADAARMRLALDGHLDALPAPAQALALTADGLGPPPPQGDALFDDGEAQRRARLRDAVRQARCAAGPDAALRVLLVDPDSRVPERRAVLTPFER